MMGDILPPDPDNDIREAHHWSVFGDNDWLNMADHAFTVRPQAGKYVAEGRI